MLKTLFLLSAVAFLLYFPSLKASFTFDDDNVIVQNHLIQGLSQGYQGIYDVWSFQHSRFLTNLTFAINFYFHKLNTFGYHLGSLLIHILAALGVWRLSKLIFNIHYQSSLKIDVPFWTAVIFLVHPVNTESVSYINQRSSELVSMFYVWSVCFYVQARVSMHYQKASSFFLAVFFAFLAILSKETAVTLPLAWILTDKLLLKRKSPRWLWAIVGIMGFLVVMFFDFKWRNILFAELFSQSHPYDHLNFWTYLLTQTQVLIVFLKLIIFPFGLNLDYDFRVSQSFFDPAVIFATLFLASLIYLAFILRKSYWFISFGIFWFFISLLPHIIPPRLNVIAEHKLYLTFVLFFPVVIFGVYQMISNRAFVLLVGIILAVFGFLTLYRNILWSDPVLIWKDTVTKSPHKARPYLNLGKSLFDQGNLSEALENFQKTIVIDPKVPQAYIYSSEILYRQNKVPQAIILAQKAVDSAPDFDLSYIQQGILFARQNLDQEAIASFSLALKLKTRVNEVYKMRGMAYLKIHQDLRALEDFKVWLKYHPEDLQVLSEKANIHFKSKDYSSALEAYNNLIKYSPKNGAYYYNRSVLNQILGNEKSISEDLRMAKELGFSKGVK